MTSTPITLRLKDDIPDVTDAGKKLQTLPQSILDHAEQIYKGEKENAGKADLNTALGTGRYDSKGNLRHNNAAYDGLGWLGGRGKAIQAIIEDEVRREALLDGPNGQGRYSGLNWVDRYIHKITDEDMTKALHRDQIRARRNNEGFQTDLDELTPEQRAGVTSLTPVRNVQKMAQEERDYEALETRVRAMDLGGTSLDELVKRNNGERISKADLEQLETDLKPLQAPEIRATQSHDSRMQTEQSTRDTNESTARVNEGTLALAETKERNSNTLANAEIDFGNRKLDYEWLYCKCQP